MKRPEINELPMLNIEKAIKATQDYARELDELKHEGLSNKQAERLVAFTQELISVSDSEEE